MDWIVSFSFFFSPRQRKLRLRDPESFIMDFASRVVPGGPISGTLAGYLASNWKALAFIKWLNHPAKAKLCYLGTIFHCSIYPENRWHFPLWALSSLGSAACEVVNWILYFFWTKKIYSLSSNSRSCWFENDVVFTLFILGWSPCWCWLANCTALYILLETRNFRWLSKFVICGTSLCRNWNPTYISHMLSYLNISQPCATDNGCWSFGICHLFLGGPKF